MTPEEIIREALARQGVELQPGSSWPVYLHNAMLSATGGTAKGPHLVGKLDAVARDEFRVLVTPRTPAGRTARELLREGLLDVVYDDGGVRLIP